MKTITILTPASSLEDRNRDSQQPGVWEAVKIQHFARSRMSADQPPAGRIFLTM